MVAAARVSAEPDITVIKPEPEATDIDTNIRMAHQALLTCERELDEANERTEGLRRKQAKLRVEIGALLVEAKATAKRGQWEPYLQKLGISSQRASDFKRCYEQTLKSPTSGDAGDLVAPTLAEAGIDRRPRKQLSSPFGPRATRELCELRLRATLVRMIIAGGSPSVELLRAALEVPDETKHFGANNEWRWTDFSSDHRVAVVTDIAATLRTLADLVESVHDEEPS